MEELVFNGSDVQYRMDAAHKFFSEVPKEKIVVPLDDVTVPDSDGPGTSTTGGEGADDGPHPSERRTDGLTTQSSLCHLPLMMLTTRINDEAMMA